MEKQKRKGLKRSCLVLLTSPDNFPNKQKILLSLRLSYRHFIEHLEDTFCLTPANDWFWSLFEDPNRGFLIKTMVGYLGLQAFTFPQKDMFLPAQTSNPELLPFFNERRNESTESVSSNTALNQCPNCSLNSDAWIPLPLISWFSWSFAYLIRIPNKLKNITAVRAREICGVRVREIFRPEV